MTGQAEVRSCDSFTHRCARSLTFPALSYRLPAAGWYTWRGAVVEGHGVPRDVHVPLLVTEFRKGGDTQLESALATVADVARLPSLVRQCAPRRRRTGARHRTSTRSAPVTSVTHPAA